MSKIKPHQKQQFENQKDNIFDSVYKGWAGLFGAPRKTGTIYSQRFSGSFIIPSYEIPNYKVNKEA